MSFLDVFSATIFFLAAMDIPGFLEPAWLGLVHAVTWPVIQLNQVWTDYQKGRFIRKEVARSQYRCINHQEESDTEDDQTDTEEDRERHSWTMRLDHEYPWRIERDIRGSANWKATWILEVKDLHEMKWETRKIHDGRNWEWHTFPSGHWPFPYETTLGAREEYEEQEKDTKEDIKANKEKMAGGKRGGKRGGKKEDGKEQ